jgi:hypothetical protein
LRANGYKNALKALAEEKEAEAKKLVSKIEKAMKSAFNAAKGSGSESEAMDERDDTVYEFEDELSKLGFKIDLSEDKTNEDIGGDIGDAEAEKEMDFLAEEEPIEEDINEALEPHVYERMYNLSNIKAQQAMIRAAEIMMNELTNEGFEVEEIREFFTQLIANDI